MAEPKEWLGKAAMFIAGFIMLTPHRIAMTCAPHVLKRYHLPPATVPLFIYKIHSPMELASLCGTFLANVLTWVNDSTIKTDYLKRYCSITFMWLMFLCSVMTYFIFVSGEDFGYLNYFYWNMVFFTFIYGFMSSFAFGVNFNTSLAAAGLPTSGGFTFMLHKVYKWLYNTFHWAEYDYNLMILQLATTMGFFFFTSILWTIDQCWNILEPEYQEWKVGILLKDAMNPDADASRIKNAMTALNENYNAAFNKQKTAANLPNYLNNNGKNYKAGLIIAMGIILAIIVLAIIVGIFPGIYVCFSVDFNDNATVDGVKYISIYFGLLVVITVLIATVVANYIKKHALKDFDGGTGNGYKKANGLTARVTYSRQIVVVGIGVIVAVFTIITLISIQFHVNDVEFDTLMAPIFLLAFISMVSAGLFIGIVIASFIGLMSLIHDDATTTGAIISSSILLAYLVFSISTCYYLIYNKGFSYNNCTLVGFLTFGFIAAIVSAITANDGIKKLFKDPGYKEETGGEAITASGHDWSPIAMLTLSMGVVYFFYPSISPYQLVDDKDVANSIELWALLISSIPTLAVALLDIHWDASKPIIGPTGRWWNYEKVYGNKVDKKDRRTDNHQYWHLTHLAFIPYYLIIFLFFSIMHFPEGRIGKFFKGHPIRIALLSVSFNTVEELMEVVGFAGGGQQTGFTGPITQFNVLLSYFVMTVSMFTED